MSTAPTKSNTPTQGLSAQEAVAAPAPGFDDTLNKTWQENSKLIIGGCVLVLLMIVGWGGWKYSQAQAELSLQSEFELATNAEGWKQFASKHPGHTLATVAQLFAADEFYSKRSYPQAEAEYQAVVVALPVGPFRTRAQMGLAMAKVGAGKIAEGEAILKQIADDATLLKGMRAEAAYHLASLAAEAGRFDDVSKYADKVMQVDLDGSGPWLSRALQLKMKAPASAPLPSIPASLLAPGAPAANPSPAIKLPGGN